MVIMVNAASSCRRSDVVVKSLFCGHYKYENDMDTKYGNELKLRKNNYLFYNLFFYTLLKPHPHAGSSRSQCHHFCA
jgi:hypothetical protein